MPIKLPQEIVYFYEITMLADRLLYCIPQNELNKLVKQGKAQKKIIEDYPDGVDIKVSPIKFKEFQDNYGMKFDLEAELILKAFHLIKTKTKEHYFGTGFIKSQFLEDIARQIQPDFKEEKVKILKVDFKPLTFKSQKKFQKKMRLSEQKLVKKLKKHSIKEIDSKKSIMEQSFSKIEMSRGEEPFTFLSRYYKKRRGGK